MVPASSPMSSTAAVEGVVAAAAPEGCADGATVTAAEGAAGAGEVDAMATEAAEAVVAATTEATGVAGAAGGGCGGVCPGGGGVGPGGGLAAMAYEEGAARIILK